MKPIEEVMWILDPNAEWEWWGDAWGTWLENGWSVFLHKEPNRPIRFELEKRNERLVVTDFNLFLKLWAVIQNEVAE